MKKNEKEKEMKIEKSYLYIYSLEGLRHRFEWSYSHEEKRKPMRLLQCFKCQVYCCNL